MIVRLFLFVLIGVLAAGAVGRTVVWPMLGPWIRKRRGLLNASRACGACGYGTDPENGDQLVGGTWYHQRCMNHLLEETEK